MAKRSTQAVRSDLETAIEAAIAALDAFDGDGDLESGCDDDIGNDEGDFWGMSGAREPSLQWDDELTGDESEPTLGATATFSQAAWSTAGLDPWCGHIDGEREADNDNEPSLGSLSCVGAISTLGHAPIQSHWDQTRWSGGNRRDLEHEHDGSEPDADDEDWRQPVERVDAAE